MLNSAPFQISTSPNKKLFVDDITRDLSLEACIFDLIDNAVDAVYQSAKKEILLNIDGFSFSISDTGSGISRKQMENGAFMFGGSQSRSSGIGAFGIGLNRAIFKLGKNASIETEDTGERLKIDWDIDTYKASSDWNLTGFPIEKTGKIGTTINITNLDNEVSANFGNSNWIQAISTEISKRYGLLIKGGVTIFIGTEKIIPSEISLRGNSIFGKKHAESNFGNVKIEIEAGEHSKHVFAFENKKADNSELTAEYGWYIYCNDRVVILSDTSQTTGWDVEFHSQYYGFIGIVKFNGPSSELPWTTSKVDIDTANQAYMTALKTMREFSENWRTFSANPEAFKAKEESKTNTTDAQQDNSSNTAATKDKSKGTRTKVLPIQHPNDSAYIFGNKINTKPSFDVPDTAAKIRAVVSELQRLKIDDFPCSIMFLLRSLVEESCKYYRKKNNNNPNIANNTSLADTVKKCLDSMKENGTIVDGNDAVAIETLCTQRGQRVISIEYLQNSIHSSKTFLSSSLIRSFWRDIEPFIQGCLK